ncbi:MAG: exodeoxyribonuclease VII small subunit [Anaerolineae bacterium]|nr:MAG: exodeoxyribonuclease VII small subunit [Anaerolineae bacterium]
MSDGDDLDTDIQEMSFEQAMKELEVTVAKLETGDLSLEQSLRLFERGQHLAAYCNLQLETAVLKVEQLTAEGEIIDISEQ